MFDKLKGIEARFEEIERLLAAGAPGGDYSKLVTVAQERSELEPIMNAFREYRSAVRARDDASAMLESETDPDLRALAEEEFASLNPKISALEEQLKAMLLPKDPRDEKDVILEVRAGTGGDEAGLFAADLLRMYSRYADEHRWKVEIISANESGIGGFSTVIASIKGRGAFSRLKFESGVHRVQRVPQTESQGRIHTSTATVAVMAEVGEVDVQVNDTDIEVDYYRSSGAGGQHVQKNETAVRILHKPTGLVVTCQDERSQLQNRLRAMAILRARLYDMEIERRKAEEEATRRSQIGTGERSEKIRTYNYPQNRVTDHRVGITSYNLSAVMDGDLDTFIDELATRDQAEKLGSGIYQPASGADED
ncbi:Peptide chain release factor 1 [Anaerolineae bacterium]|nr:Peptide chain release factor 1 [Anaerolineae bacterium]